MLNTHLQRVSRKEVALPSVVIAEALRGRSEFALKAQPDQLQLAHELLLETIRVLQTFQVIVFDQPGSEVLKQLQKQHQSRKRYADLMIAAIALSGRHIVVTRNVKHFEDLLPKSHLQNWIDDAPVG